MARRPVHIPKTALTEKKRAAMRASDFAVPSERKYPINDLFHARLALTYVLSPSNAAYRDEVVSAVLTRYPELRFWWAARSKGVEAKRARKAVSRRASGQRKVANPRAANFVDYDVFLGHKVIDTVSVLGEADEASVRRDLIDHDGYDPRIVVIRQPQKRPAHRPARPSRR